MTKSRKKSTKGNSSKKKVHLSTSNDLKNISKIPKSFKKEFQMKTMFKKKNIFRTKKVKSNNNINRIKHNIINTIDKDEKKKKKEKEKEKNMKEKNQIFKELTIDTRLNTIENRHIINHYIKTKNIKTENNNINTKNINNLNNIRAFTKILNTSSKNLSKNLSNFSKEINIKNSNAIRHRDNSNITNNNKYKNEFALNNYKEKKIFNNKNYKNSESIVHRKNSDITNKKKKKKSTFDKRKRYIVPIIKTKRKNLTIIEDNNKTIQNEVDENKEETKDLLASKLIENKQIELLKDYQKYMDDYNDKIYKNNEKKFRFMQEEGIELNDFLKDNNANISKFLYEVHENEEGESSMDNKNIDIKQKNDNLNKINEDNLNLNINLNDELNNNKNENKPPSNNENEIINKIFIDEKINSKIENIDLNKAQTECNLESIKNVIHSKRKPKIDTFEYILKINNNIDQNRIINCTSETYQKIESKVENKEETNKEMSSSSDYIYNNKNKRKKEEIIEFMKNNRQKMKDMEIKKKEDKEKSEMKKFIEIIKLQKNIEDNKKVNQINSIKNRRITLNNKINRETNDFYVGNNSCGDNSNNPKLSIESSKSSILNQRDFYINCYETQQIYATQDNFINLFKTEPNESGEDKNKVIPNSEISYLYDKYNENNFNVSGIKKKKKKTIGDKNISIKNLNLCKERNKSKKINYDEMKKVIDRLSYFMDNYKKSTNKIDYDIKEKSNKKENISRNDYIKQDENIAFGKDNNRKYNNNITQEKQNDINDEKINLNNSQQNNIQPLYIISSGQNYIKPFDKINYQEKDSIPIFQNIRNNEEIDINNNNENKEDINKNKLNNENQQEFNDANTNKNSNEIKKINNKEENLINCQNINQEKNKEKTNYNFSKEDLDNYNEIFTSIFTYLKLIIQRNTLNDILSYGEYKYRYKIGFEQLIILFKYKPFNNLRLLQQNEYYQVILKQICMPYINRAFNKIKLYAYRKERIEEANRILEQVYAVIFLKRLLVFIEAKENNLYNFQIEEDKIIEEEKEYKSNESSLQNNNSKSVNNNLDKNENNFVNNINIKDYSKDNNNNYNNSNLSNNEEKEEKEEKIKINKMDLNNFGNKSEKDIDNLDSHEINKNSVIINKDDIFKEKKYEDNNKCEEFENIDEEFNIENLKGSTNTFNKLFNAISSGARRYSFYKLYEYYSNIIKQTNKNNNENVIDDSQKDENISNNISHQKCYSYLYESLNEKSSIYACPNSEGNDGLHKIYILLEQQQKQNTKEYNEDNSETEKDYNHKENEHFIINERKENNIAKQEREFKEKKNDNKIQKEKKGDKKIINNEENNINNNSQNRNETNKYNEKNCQKNKLENDLVNPYKEYFFQNEKPDISYEPEDSKDNYLVKNKSEGNKNLENLESRHSLIAEKLKNNFKNKYGFLNDNSVMINIINNNFDKTVKITNKQIIQNMNESNSKDLHNSDNLNIKEIKDLKDIESNILSEKEADLDENIANIEYLLNSERSHEEAEEKGKINNEKYIKNENSDIDKNIIAKDKNNQYFSLKEIYDKANDSLIKAKNETTNENKKRLYNSFGGNEKVNLKLSDNSQHSSIIKMKKDKLIKSLNEEKGQIKDIKMDNLGNFLPQNDLGKNNSNKINNFDEKKGNKNTQRNILQKKSQSISQFLNKEYNKDKEFEKEKNKSLIQNKFYTHKINFPIMKEENRIFSTRNDKILNPQNLNEILKRANDESNDSKINENRNKKASKLNQIIGDDNNGYFFSNLNSENKYKYNYLDNNYNISEDIINYNESLNSKRKTEEQIYNEKIMNQLTEEMIKKIEEEMTNSILNEILSNEINDRKQIFKTKKKSNTSKYCINSYPNSINNKRFQSTSPKMNTLSNVNLEIRLPSPGRKKSKSGNISSYLVNNKYNTFFVFSSPKKMDENSLTNTSILMKSLQEKKKEEEISYYNKIILPKFLEIIKENIKKKYYFLIKNLKVPLKIDEEKLMVDLSLQITFKKIFDKNSLFIIEKNYINENINKDVILDENILIQFNKENKYNEYIQNLNKCVFDAINELIQNQRLYGKIAEPLSWSLRFKDIDYKYKDSRFFKDLFIDNIFKEINNLLSYQIGKISENHDTSLKIPIDRTMIEKSINKELKEDETWQNFDEEETIIKLMIDKIIMNQLMKETVEILEHVQFSRKNPEKYSYKPIFSCEKIPLLDFQTKIANKARQLEINEEREEDEEEEEEEDDEENNSIKSETNDNRK